MTLLRHHLARPLCLIAVALCSLLHNATGKTITIGFSGPLSGVSQAYGLSLRNAVQLAIDETNQKAVTIEGQRVNFKLLAQDDRQDANMATTVARYLVKSDVVVVIGNTNTTNSMLTAPIFDTAHLAHISPATSGPEFTRMGHRSSFRAIGHDEQAVRCLVPILLNDMHLEKFAIISTQSSFGIGISKLFQQVLMEKSMPVRLRESISGRTYDFNNVLDRIKAAHIELIFFAGGAEQAAMLARSMKRKNVQARLVSAMAGVASVNFLQNAEDASEGVMALEYGRPPEKMPGWKKFMTSYNKAYTDNINPFTVVAYDATKLVIEAIRRANSTDRAGIVNQLHQIKYNGVSGLISFDQHGDLINPDFTLYEVKNQQWRVVKTIQAVP